MDLWLSFPLLKQHLSACRIIYHLILIYFFVNYCLRLILSFNQLSFFSPFSLTHLGHCPIFVSFGWTETSSPRYLLWVQTASDWLIIILVICPDGLKYLFQIKVQILADVFLFRCCLPSVQLNACFGDNWSGNYSALIPFRLTERWPLCLTGAGEPAAAGLLGCVREPSIRASHRDQRPCRPHGPAALWEPPGSLAGQHWWNSISLLQTSINVRLFLVFV